jgi:hypothetical protein
MSSSERQSIIKQEAGYGKSSKSGGLTPTQQAAQHEKSQKAVSRIHDAMGALASVRREKDKHGKLPTPQQARDSLVLRGRFTAEEVALAAAIRSGQPITRAQRAAAHRLGIRKIPKQWKRGRNAGSYDTAATYSPGGDAAQ